MRIAAVNGVEGSGEDSGAERAPLAPQQKGVFAVWLVLYIFVSWGAAGPQRPRAPRETLRGCPDLEKVLGPGNN